MSGHFYVGHKIDDGPILPSLCYNEGRKLPAALNNNGKATIMQSTLKLTTRGLPGKRIEVYTPELTEGEDVEVTVVKTAATPPIEERQGVWDFVQSLPPSTLTAEDWERIEREFQEERNSWGD